MGWGAGDKRAPGLCGSLAGDRWVSFKKYGWVPSPGFLLASAAQVYAVGWASPWPNAEDSLSFCYNLHLGPDKAAQPHSLPAESPWA